MRHLLLLPLLLPISAAASFWDAPERPARVESITPGRRVAPATAATLLKEETSRLLAGWEAEHGAYDASTAFDAHEARISGSHLLAQPPIGPISPYARPLETGAPASAARRNAAMINWCPLHNVMLERPQWNPERPLEIRLSTGDILYARAQDYPDGHPFKPDRTVPFTDLDGTVHQVPAVTIDSPEGSRWEVYPTVCVDVVRWREMGDEILRWMWEYQRTGDPFAVHQIARALDQSAEVYHRLPLAYRNQIATLPDGSPLTREAWEKLPTGNTFTPSSLGVWNRATPIMNRGWVTIRSSTGRGRNDLTWVEPFAFARHHPAFREYSLRRHGSQDALDQKVRRMLMGEIAHLLKTGSGHIWQCLIQNYQNAEYSDLYLLGVLLDDPKILAFGGAANEVTLYNHHHYDGLTAEGAPNYMAMLGHYYRNLRSPQGWPLYQPLFAQQNPFAATANGDTSRLTTARGLPLEIGDQHLYAWPWNRPSAPIMTEDPATLARLAERPSANWPGFGLGILRAGAPDQRLEASLSYTRQSAHAKSDIMGIDLWYDGFPIIRRGGYAAKGGLIRGSDHGEEAKALAGATFPFKAELMPGDPYFFRGYAASPLAQNAPTMDRLAPDNGNKGLPRLVAFWSGDGEARPTVQAIEAVDDTSFERLGHGPASIGRTLFAVEGRTGRAVLIDIAHLRGGREHRLYTGIWGKSEVLPPVAGRKDNFAAVTGADPRELPDTEYWNGGRIPGRFDALLTGVSEHAKSPVQEATWRIDYAAWRHGVERTPPSAASVDPKRSTQRLRLLSLSGEGTLLHSARGPWVANVTLPVEGVRERISGNVAFPDAISYLIETHRGEESFFVRVLEPSGGDTPPELLSAERIAVEGAVALKLNWRNGDSDLLFYNPSRREIHLPGEVKSDGRYGLLREKAGEVPLEAHLYEGTYLASGKNRLLEGDAFLEGKLVDLKADLTGFRDETLLVLEPSRPWKDLSKLAGLPVEVRIPGKPFRNEWHRVAAASAGEDGRITLRLEGAPPLARGWHQATQLGEGGELSSWRPFWMGMNTLLNHHAKAYFPRLNRTLTLLRTESGSGGSGRVRAWLEVDDLQAAGIRRDDWFLIHDITPGCTVSIALGRHWRAAP